MYINITYLDHREFCLVGVLHHDISQGNVIIAICGDKDTCGQLIDLDHAKAKFVCCRQNVPCLNQNY